MDAEPGVDDAALEALAARDWQVKRWPERNLYFGGVQAVVRESDGRDLRRRRSRAAAAWPSQVD